MKIGDLVTFTPESWGTPIEDRPLYIVVRVPYETSNDTRVSFEGNTRHDEAKKRRMGPRERALRQRRV